MNCRNFTAEFEERRAALTEAAKSHLNDCPDCEKTSGEQTRVWQMIDALKRIDAPKTFDFRVKARIADSKSSDFQPRFLPVLRYVLPVCVVVMLLGLIAFNTNYFSSGDGFSEIVETSPQTTIENKIPPVNSFSSNQTAIVETGNAASITDVANLRGDAGNSSRKEEFTATNASQKSPANVPKKNVKEEGGGSHDLALTKSSEQYPTGINPNQKFESSPNIGNSKIVTDKEIWEFFGIEVNSENGSRKVQTVKQNSPAGRSDVKAGDVIEAIDGEKLSAEPINTKTFAFKRLTVLRGTEKIEIILQK